jgi:hypothetical protein
MQMVPGTWITETLVLSTGVQASLELYRATRDAAYRRKALELAPRILAAQQRAVLARDKMPVAGFFYETSQQERILRYSHRAHDQAPIAALAGLCEAFPEHPDWMRWYGAAALHSEYLRSGAAFSAPYRMLASSLYREDEHLQADPKRRETFGRQIRNGIPVAAGYRLRLFPVWFDAGSRGNNGVLLSQAKALAIAARLRGSLALANLAQQQMEWAVGRNPFAESIIYGEGHGYASHYSAMSGQIVGSLPVGIETRGDRDVPYWPDSNFPTWKETWTHSVSRWLFLAGDVSGAAAVAGRAAGAVVFRNAAGAGLTTVHPDGAGGRFHARLPRGDYVVEAAGQRISLALLPGGVYDLDLRPGRDLDYQLEHEAAGDGRISFKVLAAGIGRHRLSIRSDNLDIAEPEKELDLTPGSTQTITWQGRVRSKDAPWVVVVFPNGDLSRKKDLLGFADGAMFE